MLALDTETTGLDPTVDRIVEIAWATFADTTLVDQFESLVNPGRPLPPVVRRLTGLTDGLLARAPLFPTLLTSLVAAMNDVSLIVAYNASFDRAFLQHEFQRCGQRLPDIRFADPLPLIRAIDDDESHTLRAAAERYGVAIPAEHRALPDAIAAGKLFVSVCARLHLHSADDVVRAMWMPRLVTRTGPESR